MHVSGAEKKAEEEKEDEDEDGEEERRGLYAHLCLFLDVGYKS